ncbi:hypothetical protein A9Q79_10285 [Methylophaga sp. 42_25_T18]|nr:hypothetical protein A9Q79_10285 [Methylophaga sp. 42_25_T18]
MKNFIQILLDLGFILVSAVTAESIIAYDHAHKVKPNSNDVSQSGRTNKNGCNNTKRGSCHCH